MNSRISYATASLVVLGLTSLPVYSAEELKTNQQKYSYAIGVQVANNLMSQDSTLDPNSLALAIKDVLSGKPLRATPEELNIAIKALHEEKTKQKKEQAKLSLKDGKAFQAEYKKDKAVTTLKNGLQYKVLTKGKGKKPKSSDTIIAHYEGKLINGKVFDSSFKRKEPATFPVNAVIQGWQEIIPMMPLGSIWEVVIPAELAYGDRGAGKDIGPGETLIFKIELISIKS